MKHYRLELLALMLGAAMGYAQTATTVNQGSPGKQGPWPVTVTSGSVTIDGGVVQTYPLKCSAASPQNKYATTGGPQTIGGAANRVYTVVTNNGTDGYNGGTGFIKCRADGVVPTLAAGTPGTILTVGNSVNYTNAAADAIQCIGASGLYIGSFECVP